jgi:hypothetical protein
MESGLKVLSVKKIASGPSRPQAKFVSELDDAISHQDIAVQFQPCPQGQGNLLAAPLPADATRDLMSRPRGLRHSGGLYAA